MVDFDPSKLAEMAFAAGVGWATAKLTAAEALRRSKAALSKLDETRRELSEYREAKAKESGELLSDVKHNRANLDGQQRQLDVFRQQLTDALLFAEDARERRQRGR